MRLTRSSGILLHPTSLPGRFGIGDLGREAYRFVDWLAGAGQTFWQIMPLGPTGYGDSPYSSFSAFAGNPPVSPDVAGRATCSRRGRLRPRPTPTRPASTTGRSSPSSCALLARPRNFQTTAGSDTSLRRALRGFLDSPPRGSTTTPCSWRSRTARRASSGTPGRASSRVATDGACGRQREVARPIEAHKFFQFVFFRQWTTLKRYANERGVQLIGDMPIFVAHDCADVWAQPASSSSSTSDGQPARRRRRAARLLQRDRAALGQPALRLGRACARDGFAWWIARLRATLQTRATSCGSTTSAASRPTGRSRPATTTADDGRWVNGPGRELFDALARRRSARLPIIAEDLGAHHARRRGAARRVRLPGHARPAVRLRRRPATTRYLPHNYPRNCVVYTGTHDNDTTRRLVRQRSPRGRAGRRTA